MQFSPALCYFLSLRPKYCPQHPVKKSNSPKLATVAQQFIVLISFRNVCSHLVQTCDVACVPFSMLLFSGD
jgi:hypothetical protein